MVESVSRLRVEWVKLRIRYYRSLLWARHHPFAARGLKTAATVAALLLILVGIPAIRHTVDASASLSSGCDSMNATAGWTLGKGSWVVYYCQGPHGWEPVIIASENGSATPVFVLERPWTDLYLISNLSMSTDSCGGNMGAIRLDSGRSVAIPRGGYIYCADYGPTSGTLPGISIGWMR